MSPRARWHRRAAAPLVAVFALVALVAAPSLTTPAHAVDGSSEVDAAGQTHTGASVTIASLNPATVTSTDDDITIRGQVKNPSAAPIEDASVSVQLGMYGINRRDYLQAWNRGSTRIGLTLTTAAEGDLGTLPAGATRPFSLVIHASDLPRALTRSFGAHALRVSLNGRDADAHSPRRQASEQTFLLFDTVPETYKPTPLLAIAQATATGQTLTSLTSTVGAGTSLVRDDFLPDTPPSTPADGVSETLQALTRARIGMAYIVDPALLDQASPLLTSSMQPRRRTDVTIAPTSLAALTAATRAGASVTVGLWGAPDRALTVHSGHPEAIEAAETLRDNVISKLDEVPTGPIFEPLSSLQNDALPQAGTTIPVVPDTAVEYDEQRFIPDAHAHLANTSHDVLVSDSQLSQVLNQQATTPNELLRQRQMAAALLAQQNAEQPNAPRLTVVTLSPEATARESTTVQLTDLFRLGWVEPQTAQNAVARNATETIRPVSGHPATLPGDVTDALGATQKLLNRLPALADHAPLISRSLIDQRAFALSHALTTNERETLAARLATQTAIVCHAVRPNVPPSVNVISRDAEVPIQVTNNLPYPVRVTVFVRPTAPLITTHTQVARIPGRSSTTVRVPVQVRANGPVNAAVTLRDRDGNTIGTPIVAHMNVHMGVEDRFMLVLGGIVVVLFLAGLVRSIMRGRKMDPAEDGPGDGEGAGAEGSATEPEGVETPAEDAESSADEPEDALADAGEPPAEPTDTEDPTPDPAPAPDEGESPTDEDAAGPADGAPSLDPHP